MNHKFGVELPKAKEEVLALYVKNGNAFWVDAIAKEMENVKVAFKNLPEGDKVTKGHQLVRCCMVFDIKTIHMVIICLKEYNVISNGLQNHPTLSGDDELMIEEIEP